MKYFLVIIILQLSCKHFLIICIESASTKYLRFDIINLWIPRTICIYTLLRTHFNCLVDSLVFLEIIALTKLCLLVVIYLRFKFFWCFIIFYFYSQVPLDFLAFYNLLMLKPGNPFISHQILFHIIDLFLNINYLRIDLLFIFTL